MGFRKTTGAMSGMIVLLPWGCGHEGSDDDVRCSIEQMGGEIAYAKPPAPPWGAYGRAPSEATHEYVPDGAATATGLPILLAADFRARRDAERKRFLDFLSGHVRTAYVPVLAPTVNPGRESRYFGRPWMPKGLKWPKLDGEPMNFVLQLDVAALPGPWAERLGRDGLLLFFHAEGYDPEDQSFVALVDPTLPGGLRDTPDGAHENQALAIADWRAVEEHPNGESLGGIDGYAEFSRIAIGVGSHTCGMVTDLDGTDHPEGDAIARGVKPMFHTFECDKLGGWPCWEQGDETPEDGDGNPMEYVMQIGHEGLLLGDLGEDEIAWPTWGRGHIFASAATGEFKYVWACD